MGKILSLRRRRGAIPDFEASLARLSEELVLTESFTEIMLRDGNLQAAAAAVDEQRDRLRAAEAEMLASLKPRSRRTQLVAAAVAAVMMLGSGAVVAMRALDPGNTAKVAIERLEEGLEQVEAAPTSTQANQNATSALSEITNIGEADLQNPEIGVALLQLLDEKIATLEGSSPTLKALTQKLRKERERVRKHVESVPVPPQPSPSRSADQPPPQPPATAAPVSS